MTNKSKILQFVTFRSFSEKNKFPTRIFQKQRTNLEKIKGGGFKIFSGPEFSYFFDRTYNCITVASKLACGSAQSNFEGL